MRRAVMAVPATRHSAPAGLGALAALVVLVGCAPVTARVPADARAGDGGALLDAEPTGDGALADAEGSDAAALDAPDGGPRACPVFDVPTPLALTLVHGAFPGSDHPDAVVHVPAGLDACAPVSLIVFFHGFNNCVRNVLSDVDSACTAGGPTRSALHLASQLDRAAVNAVLVAIELRHDEATGAPGAIGTDGGLRALLDEVMDEHLASRLGRALGVADLDRIVLSSHSGGYTAVARGLELGGVEVDEVQLYDSLYGEVATYEAFTVGAIDRFDPTAARPRRFSIVFTDGGGTAGNSRALGDVIQTALGSAGDPAWLLFDDTTATLDPPAFAHPLLVKHSMLSHDGVVLYYFERLVRASGFAPLGG